MISLVISYRLAIVSLVFWLSSIIIKIFIIDYIIFMIIINCLLRSTKASKCEFIGVKLHYLMFACKNVDE